MWKGENKNYSILFTTRWHHKNECVDKIAMAEVGASPL